MSLNKEFVEQMLSCRWLHMCGKQDGFEFDIEYLKSKEDVEKNMNSIKWENLCLDRIGDFTSYLSKEYKVEYKKYWNDTVRMIKKEYIPIICDNIIESLNEIGLSVSIIEDIKNNIIAIFMIQYYSEYYSSSFYEQMLKIYLMGHLPCGWSGEYPTGVFLVY